MRTRSVRPAALTVAAAALLAGCTAGDADPTLPAIADVQLHPVGDPGRWFSEAYADGLGGRYSTMNTLCGVGDGVAVETLDASAPDFGTQVQARSLDSGAVLWTLPDLSCAEGAVREGAAMLSTGPGESAWRLVDARSGATREEFALTDPDIGAGRVTARVDDLWVVESEQQLVGIGPRPEGGTGRVWQRELGTRVEVTPLGDGMLGVSSGLDGRLSVVDGRTGEVRYETTGVDVGSALTWASDGFVLRVNQSDPEYAFFDLDGEEIDRTVGESQYPFAPRGSEGVTLPIADHVAAGKVTAVARDGAPALFEDRGRHYTRAGQIDLRGSSVLLSDVSADGSMIIVDEPGGEGFIVIDAEGEDVLRWSPPYSELRVEAGYLVVSDLNVTDVLLPR
ncbi:hypothetical protein JD276_00670 [Leucobacter sp. CSA1]|uniref:Pyrroloquinoline-quinone binding quinoprotein n=1 Tax=Leucobacter chromiisoli TaxID=2796471 RepID=A0A934Q4S2_9MICO|nr:hypothetical protein [Leucobacter chromiisoli]MBK0417551.1 hypothetical protein [Leucobacter chromiisoli]